MPRTAEEHALKGRIARALSAGLVGQGLGIAIQLLSVPLLLSTWGTVKYGEWLILSAIPTYLSMSDVGFATAAGNDMTIRVSRGDRKGALRDFQSAWGLTSAVSLMVALVATMFAWLMPLNMIGLVTIEANEARVALTLLSAHVIAGFQSSVISAGFRCDGRYATGMMLSNVQRLLEFGSLAVAALLSGSLAVGAMAYLCGRVLGVVLSWVWLRRGSDWLHTGLREARWQTIKELAGPAASFMAFPLGHALGLQGVVSVVGAVLGPAVVPLLTTHRTIANALQSFMSVLNHSVWPEFSAAYGAGDLSLARRLHRGTMQAALWLTCGGCLVMGTVAEPVIVAWTRGHVLYDRWLFFALLASSAIRTLWMTSLMVPLAINRLGSISFAYVSVGILTLTVTALTLDTFGVIAAAMLLVVGELVLLWIVVRLAVAIVDDRAKDLLEATLRPPHILSLISLSLRK